MKDSMLWSDAWVLLASIYTGREKPASLEEVIAAADFINHAIVTFEEMEGALARLTADDFLHFSEGRLLPTEKTLVFYRGIAKPRRRVVLADLRDLEGFIGARAWSADQNPRAPDAVVSFPALTQAAFAAAVESYHRRTRVSTGRRRSVTGVKRKK